MDARTIAGAGLLIGGGLVGYRAMKDLASLGCYGPAAYLTLGLTGIGAGLFLFGRLRTDAVKAKVSDMKEEVSSVMASEYYPWLPEGMDVGDVVVPNSYGDTSSAAGMPDGSGRGVPQWYGSAEGRKYGKRDRYTDRWGNARYFTRRKDGSIVTSVNIAGKRGAVANDRRQGATTYKPSGYRQMGDAKPVGRVERAMKNMFGADEVEAGLPVIPDSYGTNSALDSGQGVPVWYGSAEMEDYNYQSTMGDIDSAPFTEGTVNPMTFTRLGAYDFPVIDNSEGQDSAIGGRGVPEWYGSAEGDYEDWQNSFDNTEYEYKDVELVKPFKTGFLGALGVIMAPVAVTFSAALLGMFFNRGE